MEAIPNRFKRGYNQPEIHDESIRYLTAHYNPGEFNERDYPVLIWLQSALAAKARKIFDLGGNIGLGYYSYKRFISYPEDIRWTVCEIEEIVKAGEAYSATVSSPGLSYTTRSTEAEDSDIFLTCGTLQYLDTTLADLLGKLQKKPSHLLINRVPMYEGETYFTIQNIIYTCTPYCIQNRSDFIDSLTSLGYELIDSWKDHRTLSIPFHPEKFVNGYHGFYLKFKP
jgi:putative methyltransferase (TIGR04325 family)